MISTLLDAQKISYHLRMSKPQSHYFEVEMLIEDNKQNELSVKMPVWAPGSYLVREFSKNVNIVNAYDVEKNIVLPIKKSNKNTWKIQTNQVKKISIKYEVYAFELSVRTSYLDILHGFVSGSSVFMYVDQWKDIPGILFIHTHPTFKKVSTPLAKMKESLGSDNIFLFQFKNYDELVDSPIEIGNHQEFEFDVNGIVHRVAIYGESNADFELMKKDMKKIVLAATDVFKENPNKEYLFIIHNVSDGQGGLEHSNSCTLSVDRDSYDGDKYLGFLSLVAHEYFHLWNVKRIRPIELGPFDYDNEVYTDLLWVMEGFTSYYDELLLKRAGYYTNDQLLAKINSGVNYVEGTYGSRIQPVAHASFDAWIKAYRPNENSSNTTMTYYSRGAMLAALIDVKIIQKFNGEKCLDHFLQNLYQEYYKKMNRGFTSDEFKNALSAFLQEDCSPFFEDFVYGTKTPDFSEYYKALGVNVAYTGTPKVNFGASINNNVVRSVRRNSTAENLGLQANDVIISLNDVNVKGNEFEKKIQELSENSEIKLLVSRDQIQLELHGKMNLFETPSYRFSFNGEKNKLQKYWLREIF